MNTEDNNTLKCDECGITFKDRGLFIIHMRAHAGDTFNMHKKADKGERRFTCKECGKTFKKNYILTTHMKIHTGEKPFKCDNCGLAFSKKYSLKEHMRVHTGVKPFKCDFCEKEFTQKGTLNKHMMIHTGEKPFKCDICGKAFIQNGNLVTHKTIHTGEKPFQCEICGVAFPYVSKLTEHMKIHPNKIMYTCRECGKTSGVEDQLTVDEIASTATDITKASQSKPQVELPSIASNNSTASPPQQQVQQKVNSLCTGPDEDELPQANVNRITMRIVNHLIQDLPPISQIESEAFKDMISECEPRYKIPSRETFTENIIPKIYDNVAQKVKTEIENKYVSLTADSWTSKDSRSYVTVTAHFISDDFEMCSKVLQTQELEEVEVGVNTKAVLQQASVEWGCNIMAITTDSTSNMKGALGCFVGALNRLSNKVVEVEEFQQLLDKIRMLVKFFNRNTTANRVFKTKQTRLNLPSQELLADVQACWTSTYRMVARFLVEKDAIKEAANDAGLEMIHRSESQLCMELLASDDVQKLDQYMALMTPIYHIMLAMSEAKKPTVGMILPFLNTLKDHLTVDLSDSAFVKSLKRAVCDNLSQQNADESVTFFLEEAAALDPTFKHLANKATWDRIKQKMVAICSQDPSSIVVSHGPDFTKDGPPLVKLEPTESKAGNSEADTSVNVSASELPASDLPNLSSNWKIIVKSEPTESTNESTPALPKTPLDGQPFVKSEPVAESETMKMTDSASSNLPYSHPSSVISEPRHPSKSNSSDTSKLELPNLAYCGPFFAKSELLEPNDVLATAVKDPSISGPPFVKSEPVEQSEVSGTGISKLPNSPDTNGMQSLPVISAVFSVFSDSGLTPCKKRAVSYQLQDDIQEGSTDKCSSLNEHALKELQIYKSEPKPEFMTKPISGENPLVYWKQMSEKLPMLSKVVKSVLCAQACSVPPERVFPAAADISAPTSVDSHLLDMLIFLNKNMSENDLEAAFQ